jgi:hypothetical protein
MGLGSSFARRLELGEGGLGVRMWSAVQSCSWACGSASVPSALTDLIDRAGRERDAEQVARGLNHPARYAVASGQRGRRRLRIPPRRRVAASGIRRRYAIMNARPEPDRSRRVDESPPGIQDPVQEIVYPANRLHS